MQIPQIRMTSQMGKIAIEQKAGNLDIVQPKAEVAMKQPKANISIHTSKGKLTIDQTQAWEEANLMSPLRLSKRHAQAAKQAVLGGIQKRAQQGAQLIDIHLGGNMIAQQAIQNGHRTYRPPSLTYIPSPLSVKTHYEKGQVTINVDAKKPVIDIKANQPVMQFNRGDVHISMKQHPFLMIEFEG